VSIGRRRKTKMRSLRKHKKAVSPVLSVLLMIAVAVAASLVTYAWVMGYLGNTTSKVGKAIQIQSMAKTGTDELSVWVQNVGDGPVKLDSLYVNGVLKLSGQDIDLPKGNTTVLKTTDYDSAWNPPNTVKVKVVCNDGTFIEATQTVPVP
jgi:flagellin-like protein